MTEVETNFMKDGVGIYPDLKDERLIRLEELVKTRRAKLERNWPSPSVIRPENEHGVVGPYQEQKIALDTAQAVIDFLAGKTKGVSVRLPKLGEHEFVIIKGDR